MTQTKFMAQLGVGAAALVLSANLAVAQDASGQLAPITVWRTIMDAVKGTSTVVKPEGQSTAPAKDGGSLLKSVPGVAAGRMGGHGVEIVIRGQQGNQLNIIDNGSITYGGCPNRMDPPASTMAFERADEIVVERGYSSVANGPGGSGGTVKLVRKAPGFEEGKRISGKFTVGGATNAKSLGATGAVNFDLGNGFYIKGSADYKDANDYKDGNGDKQRSAYTQKSFGATFGYQGSKADFAFDIERDIAEDVLFAGAGMDSPSSKGWVYRARGGVNVDAGAFKRIEGNVYLSEVDHVMDNYSLRPVPVTVPATMAMRVPTTSDTWGGKIESQMEFSRTKAQVGFDYQSNDRLAILYAGPNTAAGHALIEAETPANSRFIMWPDVTISQAGIYGQSQTEITDKTLLRAGLRYDHVKASEDYAAGRPGYAAAAPNTYYNTFYATNFNDARTEDNFGGLLRLEYEIVEGATLFAGVSRSVRTADANERAMGRNTWVGDPDINPEKHHQADFGLAMAEESWSLNASAYIDRVDDYILRYGVGTTANPTRYRNVSAELYGVELSGLWNLSSNWELSGDMAYTHGENRTENRPLGQIPPLQGKIALAYATDEWKLGTRLNWAAKQNRIDPARDAGKTKGYATVDFFGSYNFNDNVTLFAGVDNVLDKAYANHLNRTNVFDAVSYQVNEPGRSFYLKLETKF